MSQSYACLLYHAVFSTKNREPWIRKEIRAALYATLGGIACNIHCPLLAVGGIEDHVHLLLSAPRDKSVSAIIRTIKCNSTNWVHEKYPDLRCFAWQTGYGAFSVSFSQRDLVRKYLEKQEEHHRKQSYAQELGRLLQLHEISFDPKTFLD